MRLVLSALWIAFFALLGSARAASADSALSAAIDGAWREPQSRARDAYRHPYESLTFWGLKPGMTVVEVNPGVRGWWTEILAPYAASCCGARLHHPAHDW
jgi:predicted methyltransferase